MTAAKTASEQEASRRQVETGKDGPAGIADDGTKADALAVDFGEPEARIEEIGWPDFFEVFKQNDLVFRFREKSDSHVAGLPGFFRAGG